jgi:acyl-CoA synthetase (AMP-forming)/AMP-acid ligase II
MKPQGLDCAFSDALRARHDLPAMIFVDRRGVETVMTGAEIAAGVAARASLLNDWLGAGNRLVLALPKTPEFALLFLACVSAGIAVVPVAVPRRGTKLDRFTHILRDANAAAVVCAPDSAAVVADAMQAMPGCPVVTIPLLSGELPAPRVSGPRDMPEVLVQYTSGSGHLPKGVRITGSNILANARLVAREWQMDHTVRVVNWQPHYHDMGLMGGILYPLLCGGMSVQIQPLDFIRKPVLWLEVISRYRANFSGGPAFSIAEILRRVPSEALEGLDLSCWSKAYCGSEPVPSDLGARLHAHLAGTGFREEAFFACYGMAEMTLFVAGSPGRPPAVPGLTLPCTLSPELRDTIRIAAPETGAHLRDGLEGEILLRGASQGAGYLSLEDETALTFRTGHGADAGTWLRTGDIGRIDDDGLHVTGRIKDIVICNGTNIAAPEIELIACRAHGGVNPMAAAAFSPSQSVSGEVVVVAERSTEEVGPADAERERQAARVLAGEWGLKLVALVSVARGRLPRTTSGKIRRRAVADAYRNGTLTAEQPVTSV